jgi:hypothetical protein
LFNVKFSVWIGIVGDNILLPSVLIDIWREIRGELRRRSTPELGVGDIMNRSRKVDNGSAVPLSSVVADVVVADDGAFDEELLWNKLVNLW